MILFLDHINITLFIFFAVPVLRKGRRTVVRRGEGEGAWGEMWGQEHLTSLSRMSRDTQFCPRVTLALSVSTLASSTILIGGP